MKPKNWSILLILISLSQWFYPQWNGFLFDKSQSITIGEGRIVSAIFFVGALFLWYLNDNKKK